jgi:hypothetical protein
MAYHIKAVVRNGPKWDPAVHPTIFEFLTTFPEHDVARLNEINDFLTTLVGIFAVNRPADPALGDDDTVSWVHEFEVQEHYSVPIEETVALLLAHLESRKDGPIVKAHGYTIDITSTQI